MVRGRPQGDEPTCVLAVRVPIALREALDRYLDALETRIGLKASRTCCMRHIPRQRPVRRVVCRVAASWRREVAPGAIVGLPAGSGVAHNHRMPAMS